MTRQTPAILPSFTRSVNKEIAAHDVLHERIAGLGGTRGDGYGRIDREAGVRSLDHAFRRPLVQELALQRDCSLREKR